MHINPALLADLRQLTVPLDLSDTELPRSIQLLEDAAALAVGSPIAWVLTMTSNGQPVTLTSIPARWTAAVRIRASLLVPVSAVSGVDADETVVLYSDHPGAFDRLRSDIASALRLSAVELCLDQDLTPHLVTGVSGVRELSQINQAAGRLVNRLGATTETDPSLEHDATVADLTAYRMATRLINGLPPGGERQCGPRYGVGDEDEEP